MERTHQKNRIAVLVNLLTCIFKQIQEETYRKMLKRETRMGLGEKSSDIVTVQPYHENRVELFPISLPTEEDLTFINASYVDQKRYIAAAMPHNLASERDFWRMIYEQRVKTVVMLNKPTERKKNAYWPQKKEKIRAYTDVIKVVLLSETYDDAIYCWVRKLQVIVNLRYYLEGEPEWDFDDEFLKSYDFEFSAPVLTDTELALQRCSTTVNHLQYDDWQDMSIPDDKEVFYQFMYMTCKQHEDRRKSGPMVVHCFGGVGRTGTFLVIHSTIQKMTRLGGKAINVLDILAMMREERSSLVQTPEQYKFCYRMIWQFYEDRRFFAASLSAIKANPRALKDSS